MTPVSGTVLLGLVLCIMVTCAAKTTDISGSPSNSGLVFADRLLREQRAVRVRVKRGICPLDLDYPKCDPATMTERAQCQTDRDCPGQRKCCISGCRSRCVLPLQHKKGGCPAYDPSICIYTKPLPNECHRDDQCPGAQRCCCLNCRRQCIGSQRVKPGQCPAKQRSRLGRMCKKDGQCAGRKKCCDYSGNRCANPVRENPGYCPVAKEQLACGTILETPLCRSDAECPFYQKCCVLDNKMQCVDSVKVKPGECEVSVSKCTYPPPRPRCRTDRDCPGSKKCCTPRCFQECTDPIVVKPGECPVSITSPCTTPATAPLCENDSHCLGNQKCCEFDCVRQCVDPAGTTSR